MSPKSKERLISFFYELLRDHVHISTVEGILQRDEVDLSDNTVVYSNPYLAAYAEDIVERLAGNTEFSKIKNRIIHRTE